MKARRAQSAGARARTDEKRAGTDGKMKVIKLRALTHSDAERIQRILRWEDESATAEFIIAGPRVTRVDAE